MDVDAEKLLYLIEARSPIYNFKSKEYTNKLKVEQLWEEVASAMNCQVSECKNKWKILRNCYSRFIREEKSKTSGSGGKRKRKWYLADAMSFLKDYMNQHGNCSRGLDSRNGNEDKDEIMEVDSLVSLDECIQPSGSNSRNTIQPKKCRASLSEMVAGPMIEFLQSRTKTPEGPESGNQLFFKSLLADYEKLSSKSQRKFKMNMLSKMSELQEGEENQSLVSTSGAMTAINFAGEEQRTNNFFKNELS